MLFARLKYGPIIAEGEFQPVKDDYESLIKSMDGVDISLFEKISYTDITEMKTKGINLSGTEVWGLLEDKLSSGKFNIPFKFEHRNKNDTEYLLLTYYKTHEFGLKTAERRIEIKQRY